MPKHWIAVASAAHVALGRAGGFVQVCHGKAGPLRRMAPGDGVACYSPAATFGGRDRLRAFTALGTVADAAPVQVEMQPGFTPWRRAVDWQAAREAAIGPLLARLDLTRGRVNWGAPFRFGLVAITAEDFARIGEAMAATAA